MTTSYAVTPVAAPHDSTLHDSTLHDSTRHDSTQHEVGGEQRSRIGWRLGATALVVGAVGNTAQAVLSQVLGERPESVAGQVALANEHPTLMLTMCVVGTVAVPFMAVGFLAAAQELRRSASRTGLAAGLLLLLGMWGFLAVQVTGLVGSLALLDPEGAQAAAWLDGIASEPLLAALFGIPFLAGCVLGMLTLTLGLLVTGAVPRWIPASWLVFILLDFSIGDVGPVDPHWLYLAGAVGLAAHLAGRRRRAVA